jgi:phospholipid/cholesterol/gamma-HCH transport system permease protein
VRGPLAVIEGLGARMTRAVEEIGIFMRVCALGVAQIFLPPLRPRLTFKQMEFIGVQSLTIILITGAFTGAVFTLQAHYGFSILGAEGLTGSTVALSLTRELGPTLSALMITARAGSAIAAELGTMRVTEQIDALEAMAVDPYDYLVAPRVLAGTLMVPVMAMVFNGVGVLGSWVVGTRILNINQGAFIYRIEWYLDPDDVTLGLAKAAVFGFVLSVVGCYKGLAVTGGAAGVGRASTAAVVISSVSILIIDYFLTDWWMT